jgi:hypothetical protein
VRARIENPLTLSTVVGLVDRWQVAGVRALSEASRIRAYEQATTPRSGLVQPPAGAVAAREHAMHVPPRESETAPDQSPIGSRPLPLAKSPLKPTLLAIWKLDMTHARFAFRTSRQFRRFGDTLFGIDTGGKQIGRAQAATI